MAATHILRISDRLRGSSYQDLAGMRLAMPTGKASPDDDLLDLHYQRFKIAQRMAS